MALLIAFSLQAFGDQGKAKKNDQVSPKTENDRRSAKKENPRIFTVNCEFELESKNGHDITIEGKTIPGRNLTRIHTTLDVPEGQNYPIRFSNRDDEPQIKLTLREDNLVRLEVIWKQSHTEQHEGVSSSWNITLSAIKSVKLGEKVELEFGHEKTIGRKCTFVGVIQEKKPEEK
jgi:hypothetical protein